MSQTLSEEELQKIADGFTMYVSSHALPSRLAYASITPTFHSPKLLAH